MNIKLVFKILGLILMIEAGFLLFPLIIALIYSESDWLYFLITAAGSMAVGALLFRLKPANKHIYSKEGYVIVGLAWIIMSLVGAVPFCISGAIADYFNAVFESISGFTTTGITVLTDVETLSRSMLFWRSLTHWIGGMGVLVFMLAISPVADGFSMYLMKAESPGPATEKITPKISQTAKLLYVMYIILTAAEIIALMISGLPLFESTLIAFATVATGGFSYLNTSLISFTTAQQIIVGVFMLLAGINFSLYFLTLTGRFKKAVKDIELIWYFIILAIGIILISINVYITKNQFNSWSGTIHHTVFAAISSMTSTGFFAYDYNLWPWFSKGIILLLMFIGGCAGSTAGGLKVSRIILVFKTLKRYIKESIHPRGVNVIKYNGKTVSEDTMRSTAMYFMIFIVIMVCSMLIVSQDPDMDLDTTLASVATTLNNNGIEFKNVSVGGYGTFAWWTRLVYIIDMLIGRLEILPVMAIFASIFAPVTNVSKHFKRNYQKKHNSDK